MTFLHLAYDFLHTNPHKLEVRYYYHMKISLLILYTPQTGKNQLHTHTHVKFPSPITYKYDFFLLFKLYHGRSWREGGNIININFFLSPHTHTHTHSPKLWRITMGRDTGHGWNNGREWSSSKWAWGGVNGVGSSTSGGGGGGGDRPWHLLSYLAHPTLPTTIFSLIFPLYPLPTDAHGSHAHVQNIHALGQHPWIRCYQIVQGRFGPGRANVYQLASGPAIDSGRYWSHFSLTRRHFGIVPRYSITSW